MTGQPGIVPYQLQIIKEYLKLLNRLCDITWFVAVCADKAKTSKPDYTIKTCQKISNIPYNLILRAKFNDSSILITIISISCLNMSLANEYVVDVKIPTQVIKYNHNFLPAEQPIRLHYSNKIKLFIKPQFYIKTFLS